MRGGYRKSAGMLILFMATGAVLGGILGELLTASSLLSGAAPYLVKQFPIFDVPPVTFNLYVVKLVIGFALYPNLISIIGMLTAVWLFRRFWRT